MKVKLNLVLLIDDDDDDNFFHKRAIEKSGIANSIDVCIDGYDALQYLNNEGPYKGKGTNFPQPDLIFLDINMPRINGWEFLEEYQKMKDPDKGPIIIMLTTSLNPSDRLKAEEYNIVKDFLNKPLKHENLVPSLSKAIPELKIPGNDAQVSY